MLKPAVLIIFTAYFHVETLILTNTICRFNYILNYIIYVNELLTNYDNNKYAL
jgi:hypothetical protein